MSYYGGTVTVQGRNLITSLLAGETIEFTRIVVGSGKMPDGIEPIDMTELVEPVAEATSTIPVVDNGEMRMTVEYRNDMNGGLEKGFWLHEFGIWAKTDNAPECLLYYATLGDSPQPVNAYQDNRIDIRRYPVTIALEVDADVVVSYNPGSFITAEDAEEMLGSIVKNTIKNVGSALNADIVIPASSWEETPEDDEDAYGEYGYRVDIPVENATDEHFPITALSVKSLKAAGKAKMCPTVRTFDGFVRFWAKSVPTEDLDATMQLRSPTPIIPKDGLATDDEVKDTLDDTFGKDPTGSGDSSGGEGEEGGDTGDGEEKPGGDGETGGDDTPGEDGGSSGGQLPDGVEIADDQEIQDALNEVFGS